MSSTTGFNRTNKRLRRFRRKMADRWSKEAQVQKKKDGIDVQTTKQTLESGFLCVFIGIVLII